MNPQSTSPKSSPWTNPANPQQKQPQQQQRPQAQPSTNQQTQPSTNPPTNHVSDQVQSLSSQFSFTKGMTDKERQRAFLSAAPGQQRQQQSQQQQQQQQAHQSTSSYSPVSSQNFVTKQPGVAPQPQASQAALSQQQIQAQQKKLQKESAARQQLIQKIEQQKLQQQQQLQAKQQQLQQQRQAQLQQQQLQAQRQPAQSAPAPAPQQPAIIPGKDRTAATTPSPSKGASTQSALLISELRDGLVIMKDGSFRAVVACQSINFDLMSETEREGVEYSYQNFLNSLYFTTQILIRSQRVDLGPYIDRLTNIRRNNDNMLLGVLMDDYINFIDELSQEANIMDKSFFIIIPYYPDSSAEALKNQTKKLFGNKESAPVSKISRATYNKAITEINNRVEAIVSGLFQIGIHSVRLNTRELATLYYNFNNPDTAVHEPLVDFERLATTYVKKGDKPANAPTI
ncbi:MAG: hypothetical protein Q4F60_01520 [Candidatus Saccharibacteria bacterium]|nr:hypothetical protein [Candidatus Saccharibacteria bacterium]